MKILSKAKGFVRIEPRPVMSTSRKDKVRMVKELMAFRAARKHLPPKVADEYGSVMRGSQLALITGIRACRQKLKPAVLNSNQTVMLVYERKHLRVIAECRKDDLSYGLRSLRAELRRIRARRRDLRALNGPYVGQIGGCVYLTGGVHLEKGYWLKIAKKMKSKAVYSAKRPKTEEEHFGLELEFCSPLGADELGPLLAEEHVDGKSLAEFVHLKQDGSVRPDKSSDYAHEIAILATKSTLTAVVNATVKVLQSVGSYVNASCGYHVHLDMRYKAPDAAWMNLRRCQNLLYKMAPKTRRKNTYCKPVRTTDYTVARRSGSRYVGINAHAYGKYNTIEVRLHSSTLDANKILNWVKILYHIANGKTLDKNVASVRGLSKEIPLPKTLQTYMLSRIKHFSSGTEAVA